MKLVLSLILSFIFLLWFISSVVGMFYVSRSAEYSWLLPMILGQVFLVIGTVGLIAMLSAKKKGLWIDIVAIHVGSIIVVLPLMYHYGSEQTKAAITNHIPTLAGAGFLTAGLCGTLAAYFGQKRAAEKYNTPVEGICVERKTRLGSGGTILHCPVYEITLNVETLQMEKEVYSNVGVPQIGESRTLYINENDLESYAEPIADKSARMIGYQEYLDAHDGIVDEDTAFRLLHENHIPGDENYSVVFNLTKRTAAVEFAPEFAVRHRYQL